MKIGFSFGRCIRDIVNGTVDYNDVYLVISRTMIYDSSQIDYVVEEYLYRDGYLLGLDEDACLKVGRDLYLDGKLIQPRCQGHRVNLIANEAIWMDLAPTLTTDDQKSEQVMQAWKSYQLALKMTSLAKMPSQDTYRDNF